MLKTDAIKKLLLAKTHPDLASLYSLDMECQVNVHQNGGEKIEGEYNGKPWHGWTDGATTWKPFRIPFKANSTPEYNDSDIKFDIFKCADAVGMTGWDWKNRVSRWVAYDFDAIIGHSERHAAKLTQDELNAVRDAAFNIPWVSVRKSTAGKGLHLYVFLEPVATANHHEHAALARAILGLMSALTGFDFKSKVDICGGNMWVWARKMVGTDGLTLLKQGVVLNDVPSNWRDHVKVVSGARRKNLPQDLTSREDEFDELIGQSSKIPLDSEHKKLIEYLKVNNMLWWWDQDHHMLVTHTKNLEDAHKDLSLKGIFKTTSEGKDRNTQNCFCNPLRRGAWVIRRFSPGCQEAETWEQDGGGWTKTYLNKEPDLRVAARAYEGLEDPSGGFVFRDAETAVKVVEMLGTSIKVHPRVYSRETKIKPTKDGRLAIEVAYDRNDRPDEMSGWLNKKNVWVKVVSVRQDTVVESEGATYDDFLRHLVTESAEDGGWVIKADGKWRIEPIANIKTVLQSMGMGTKEVTATLGSSIMRAWTRVNKPFQDEYPGDREWNQKAAQLRYTPSQSDTFSCPTWMKIFKHCGRGLDEAVAKDLWCKSNGIKDGGSYLLYWTASMIREPLQPLPYLFFYSIQQNTGKSIFHEAIKLLLARGAERGETALLNTSGFNAELEGMVLCIVEEIDLRQNKQAYNRIKDWVTARDLMIHQKGCTPYSVPNSSHWIQVANNHNYCPVFAGDTRITMCHVQPIDPVDLIPKKRLIPLLEKEAADFLGLIMSLNMPESPDRLNIPVIETSDKRAAQMMNQNELERFFQEQCVSAVGRSIKFSDFYDRFIAYIDQSEVSRWSKIRVSKEMPPEYPLGRLRGNNQAYIGNITFYDQKFDDKPGLKWRSTPDGKLEQE